MQAVVGKDEPPVVDVEEVVEAVEVVVAGNRADVLLISAP